MNKYFIHMFVFALCFSSCEKHRNPVDYHFEKIKEGWYYIIYESEGEPILPINDGRIQIVFKDDDNIIKTSSSPIFGTASDRFFVDGNEVKSSDLGGAYPSYFATIKSNYKTIKYHKIYIGNINNIKKYGDPDNIIKSMH